MELLISVSGGKIFMQKCDKSSEVQPGGEELNPLSNTRVKCTSPANTAFKPGLQQNVLSLDWLEINYIYPAPDYEDYSGTEFTIGTEYVVTEVQEVGYPYKWRGLLYHTNGQEVAVVQFGIRTPHANDHLFSVRFKNELLYSNYKEHVYKLNDLMAFKNIKRLDMALDTNVPVRKKMTELLFKEQSHELYDKRKRLDGVNYSFDTDSFGTIYVGSRSSDKSVAIYDKKAELEKSNKQYITRNYELAGGADLVDRVEIRLKSGVLKRYKQVDDMTLTNDSKIKELFVSTMDGYLDLKERSNDSNNRRWKTLELIDLEAITTKRLEKAETPPPNETYRAKITVKKLYLDGLKSPDKKGKPANMDLIWDYVYRYRLGEWFEHLVKRERGKKINKNVPKLEAFRVWNLKKGELLKTDQVA